MQESALITSLMDFSGADLPDNYFILDLLVTSLFWIPFCGKIRVISTAVDPSLPTRPCCCFSFHAVFGKPIYAFFKN